jgi:hypothetical protein
MKKKLFQNYEFEFDKNESKIISSFAKQAMKQMETDDRLVKEVRIFNSVISKLNSNPDKVKLTKEEKTKLIFQLNENVKHLQSKVDKAWFFTKWFYKNMLNQYQSVIYKLNS